MGVKEIKEKIRPGHYKMRNNFILLFIIFVMIQNSVFAGIEKKLYKDIFLQANKLYEAGDYITTISYYETLISSYNIKNSTLYYNLGNAYYRINNIGKTVLNYERALRLSPRDEDIRYNLKFVYSMINESIYPNILYNILTFFPQTTLAYLSLFFSISTSIFISLTMFKKNDIFRRLMSLAATLFILSFTWLVLRIIFVDKINWGIVMDNNTEVKTAPASNAPTGFIVSAGKKVVLLTIKEDWIAVKLIKENFKGWIPRTVVEKI